MGKQGNANFSFLFIVKYKSNNIDGVFHTTCSCLCA